jgi:uncharacterized membrane protein
MKTKVINLWQKLLSTYWFVPSLMAAGSVLLALAMVVIDQQFGAQLLGSLHWFYMSEADGVRKLLSTVAGSMITVTGVVFSVTVVAFSLASQQFGPRLLSNFMRDRGNQLVFGTIIATYIYCLLLLRSVGAGGFVPHFSEVVGLLLTLASLGALIYFIHHTADSIQAVKIINRVSDELDQAVGRLFPPEDVPLPADLPGSIPDFALKGIQVRTPRKGYLQAIALEDLVELAVQAEAVVRVERRPGHFIVPGAILASVWPWQQANGESLERRLHRCFIIGRQRTPEQNVEFLLDELVEMAVRALSPGINDPFTAMACIDHLSAALGRIAGRGLPAAYHFDDRKRLRVITWPTTFADLVTAAFDQIRQNAGRHAAVHIRLLEALARVVVLCTKEEQYEPLLGQARLVLAAARREVAAAADRQDVEARFQALADLMKRRFGVELAAAG